ncbi:MAG TPA: hypothetical protein VMW03_04615 [Candidatus Krumholzibacteriaceae bacterium]|nr:hypothetical protein [Candidatus Krumholzibacteriaceae bacterium]
MVNRSIAHQLLDDDMDEAGYWIIVYDFIEHKPNPNFWANLNRISKTNGGGLIQYSVYQTESLREAQAVHGLVDHYGGKAMVFRCVETNL